MRIKRGLLLQPLMNLYLLRRYALYYKLCIFIKLEWTKAGDISKMGNDKCVALNRRTLEDTP